MLKGKGLIVYSIMKISLYILGGWEFFTLGKSENHARQILLILVLIANSLFRQFYLYERNNLYRYGKASIIFEFTLGAYIAWLQPVFPCILLLTPTIFESVVAHSLYFGGVSSLLSIISLIIIDTLSRIFILDYIAFFRGIFISYVLGFIIVFIISFLASQQFRERERIVRVNLELKQAYKQLLDSASKLQELSVEKERNRMAREIHDTLAHTLTALVVQMEVCKKLIDMDPSRAKNEIENAQELTREGLGDVKRVIKALRPQILESSTLTGALDNLIQNIHESTHVKVEFSRDVLQDLELSSSVEVEIFRVIQESITNAIRHGSADRIDVLLTNKGDILSINISDNGKGCSNIKEGYGLKGITERIKGLGGMVHFSSILGKGFHVQISIPNKGGRMNGC